MCKNTLKRIIVLFLGYIGISLIGAAHAATVPCSFVGSTPMGSKQGVCLDFRRWHSGIQ